MSYNTITLTYEDRIALLTLNRPDKRNAISFELVEEFLRALDEVEASPALVLIVTGAGKAFSGGLDLDNLKALAGRTHEENVRDTQTMARLFRSIYEFPKPTVAAVNGAAIAGGTGLATMCDITVASTEAKFGYTEVRIGFCTGDRVQFPRAAGRGETCSRPAAYRADLRCGRGIQNWIGERGSRA